MYQYDKMAMWDLQVGSKQQMVPEGHLTVYKLLALPQEHLGGSLLLFSEHLPGAVGT